MCLCLSSPSPSFSLPYPSLPPVLPYIKANVPHCSRLISVPAPHSSFLTMFSFRTVRPLAHSWWLIVTFPMIFLSTVTRRVCVVGSGGSFFSAGCTMAQCAYGDKEEFIQFR